MSAETFVATFGRFSTSWNLSAQMYDASGNEVGEELTNWIELGNGRYMLHVAEVPRAARVLVVTEATYGVVQAGPVAVQPGRPRPYALHRHGPRLVIGGS